MKKITHLKSTLVKVSDKSLVIEPVWLPLKDAPNYFSMGKNRFNKTIRPQLNEIKIGRHIWFERLDLDAVARDTAQRYGCPNQSEGELIWDK
jgi:hypothetical protein